LGTSTNRDEWLYDHDRQNLFQKVQWLIAEYDKIPSTSTTYPETLKWSRNLKRRLARKRREKFNIDQAVETLYRPYCKRWQYESPLFIDESGSAGQLFPRKNSNRAICTMFGDRQEFAAIATARLPNLNLFSADAIQYFSEKRFENGIDVDNITDWALERFQAHYHSGNGTRRPISKDAIFHYVYGVLHDPAYRDKYALNLKREFPRIPFYLHFWRWADWGERLMALHIGYEQIEPWPLGRIDVPDERSRKAGLLPKPLLRADKGVGNIMLDTETQLSGIPKTAWDYRLGNRSALEWILDQHKEKKLRDPTIRERFNTYRFADHKEKVVELLTRVTRVSVETMKIVAAMKARTGLTLDGGL
jgi:predicted helicase